MKLIHYLSKEEKFIYHSVRTDIKKCTTKQQLKILETTLDKLLLSAIKNYRKQNGINTKNK